MSERMASSQKAGDHQRILAFIRLSKNDGAISVRIGVALPFRKLLPPPFQKGGLEIAVGVRGEVNLTRVLATKTIRVTVYTCGVELMYPFGRTCGG